MEKNKKIKGKSDFYLPSYEFFEKPKEKHYISPRTKYEENFRKTARFFEPSTSISTGYQENSISKEQSSYFLSKNLIANPVNIFYFL